MFISFCLLFLLAALNVSLRLRGSTVPYAGSVEVKYNGTWGILCDDGLDINVGHVICRQLNYPEAVAVPCCNGFARPSSSRFWMAGVKCLGNESSLLECERWKWGANLCDHSLDGAGVVCRAPNVSTCKYYFISLSFLFELSFFHILINCM